MNSLSLSLSDPLPLPSLQITNRGLYMYVYILYMQRPEDRPGKPITPQRQPPQQTVRSKSKEPSDNEKQATDAHSLSVLLSFFPVCQSEIVAQHLSRILWWLTPSFFLSFFSAASYSPFLFLFFFVFLSLFILPFTYSYHSSLVRFNPE